jgi:hypothetical protein
VGRIGEDFPTPPPPKVANGSDLPGTLFTARVAQLKAESCRGWRLPTLGEYWNRDHNAKRLRLYHGLGPGNGGTTSTSYSRWPNVRSDAGRPCGEVGSYKHVPSIFGTPHLHPTHPRTYAFHPHSHCVGSIVFRVYVRGVVPRN